MVGTKVFLSCLITLVIFNFLFYMMGYNNKLLDYTRIISTVVVFGIIVVVVSIIPTTSAGGSIKWLIMSLIAVTMFYSYTFTIDIDWGLIQYHSAPLTIGIGLCTTILDVFGTMNMNSLTFLPWLFFTFLGLVGVISGIIAMSGSGD